MSTNLERIGRAIAVAAVLLFAAEARATSSLYSSQCASCHSTTSTSCDGCHAHGTHSTSSKNDINIKGTTDKTSYLPGETVKVTVNGGYQNKWVRTVVFDQTLKQVGLSSCPGGQGGCTTSVYPTTMTATAPTTPGSYVWAVGWYGHKYDITGASFGTGTSTALKIGYFTADTGNANHGYQVVALPAFTVTAASGPAIALNPTALALGSVAVGSSQTLTTQVQNTGTVALNVTSVTRCVGTPTSITWTPTAAFTVAAGASAPLNVIFAPTAAGALPAGACLTIASNDPAKPTINLGLTGTGVAAAAPAIALTPASLAFPSVAVGSSQTLTTQVQNTGTATLNVTSVSRCVGTPTSITWTPTAAFTVSAGASAPLNVIFAPTATGALPAGACLTIASNDPAKPTTTLGLTGTGVAAPTPAIVLTPASLDFLTVVAGTTKTLTTQVQNTGTATLNVTSVSLCAGTPASITWTPTAAFTVAAGTSAPLNVTFAPTAAGALPAGACLTIASNDPAKPTTTLALAGTATPAPTPAIALNPASLTYPSVAVGSSQTLTTQVQNTGTATLNVTSVSRCAGTPTSITWTPTAAFTVAAGASAPFNVTFAPTAAGALPAGACLSIASNDPAQPTVTLGLSGTGNVATGATIALNPTSLNFQNVTVGTSKALAAQVQNTGTATLNVTAVSACAGTSASITWTPGTLTVAVGQSAALNVTFAPTATGALPAGACLSIASNDPAQPTVTLGLSGTAVAPAPAIALNPASLAFPSVAVGSSQTLTAQVQNTGTATLNVTSVARCAGTPTSVTWTPTAAFTVAAGASAPLSVTFTPTATGALPAGACLTVASNDPAKPTISLGLSGTGTPAPTPAIVLTPASIDFQAAAGSSQTVTARVQNTGTATLNVTSVARCAGTPTTITWTPTAAFTVGAGLSASLNVTFTPTAAGTLPAGACLTLSSNDPATPSTTLGLTGTATPAPAPAIVLAPASIDFQAVAGSSQTVTARVQNTGTATLNVTSIARCAGTPTTITWTPTAAFTVGAGLSASLNVTFTPTAAGTLPAGACLTLSSNDPATPSTTLGLTGTATPAPVPAIALNQPSIDFQAVVAGASSTSTTQVQNTGTATLNVTGVTRCAGTPTTITWTPTAAFTVAAGASATLNVKFAPTAVGSLPAGACLTIASNDPANPTTTLALAGTVIPAGPAIALDPTSIDFQTVTVGAAKTIAVLVQSIGSAPLAVTGISPCAGTPSSITWMPAAPFTVPASGSALVSISFAPQFTGDLPAGACLSIASNDPANPSVKVGLAGTATATPIATASLDPSLLDFRTVPVGNPATLIATVHNTGNAPLDITSIGRCSGTPASVAWSASVPVSVAPGGSTVVTVIFVPTAVGPLPAGSCLEMVTSDPVRSIVDIALVGSATMTGASDAPPAWGCSTSGGAGGFLGLLAFLLVARIASSSSRGTPRGRTSPVRGRDPTA